MLFQTGNCPDPKLINDNFCQDNINTPECFWDGGDCCNNDYPDWDAFCNDCTCKDPKYDWCFNKTLMNDKFCHDGNNVPECDWDGGDCCDNEQIGWNDQCEDCECLVCPEPAKVDNTYCDDFNNIPACNWDGGDCCMSKKP